MPSRVAEPGGPLGTPFADAIVVAAGRSTRMGGGDKLAELIGGRSMLECSVAAVAAATSVESIIVVTRAENVARLTDASWLGRVGGGRVRVVAGGEQRSDSVRAGVAETRAEVVLVHDAARPLVSPQLIDAVATAAAVKGAAVPVVPVVDSLKRITGGTIEASVERAGLVRTQTPQAVRRDILVAALEATRGSSFSDEAALLESRGVAVTTVPGEVGQHQGHAAGRPGYRPRDRQRPRHASDRARPGLARVRTG